MKIGIVIYTNLLKIKVEIELSTNKYKIMEQIEDCKTIPVIGNINLMFTKEYDSFFV